LQIGCKDFDSDGVALVAKFLSKKSSLTSFSLAGAPIDKENEQLPTKAIVKNKTIEHFALHSNGIKLPAILGNTKKAAQSLSKLTKLDLSSNSFPAQGAKAMARFFQKAESKLVTLILAKNRMTTKAANILLPAIKEHTTIKHLDLSENSLSDAVAPAVIDLLKDNPHLLTLDMRGNNSLRVQSGGRQIWRTGEEVPKRDRGGAEIVKGALFDTTSLQSICDCNHTCCVKITGANRQDIQNETIRKINALDASEGKKVRLKVLLAMNETNKDLYDPSSFADVPLELMPRLLEMVQQDIKYNKDDVNLVAKKPKKQQRWYRRQTSDPDSSLNRLYEVITSWNTPLLFARGAGVLKAKKKRNANKPSRKRRKFGDVDFDDDEPWVPKGARKKGRHTYNTETKEWEYIPPPVF
jgi:hypothetical protein